MDNCISPPGSRRRLFWATQPDACGSEERCSLNCGDPGLEFNEDGNGFSTENWIRGLIINMLMTDGRKDDTACGFKPGAQGGHWSSSYIESGPPDIGTLIRDIPPTGRVNDHVLLVVAYARATLERLVSRGVALSVDVSGAYVGDGRINLDIIVNGRRDDETRVGLSGSRMENGWIWS